MSKEMMKMFSLVEGNIADKKLLRSKNIDTIVNAANPTLMGSSQGVDGAIHKAIYELSGRKHRFHEIICNEMKTSDKKNVIRCKRGKACMTSGYGLCKNVIHVVGAIYDGMPGKRENCSSSRIQIMESCYSEIVKLIKEHTDIKSIAIPFIGAGGYHFPYALAVRIAITSMFNDLNEWKKHDLELFEMAGIEKIYFFIYDPDETVRKQNMETAKKIWQEYEPYIIKERRVVLQKSTKAHFRYMWEIKRYDEERGYFAIAKNIRWLLMMFRTFFLPPMWLKDIFGGIDWKRRRCCVEIMAFVKMILPVLYYFILKDLGGNKYEHAFAIFFLILTVYAVCDTMSYLTVLIIMSDIQKPSANIIRSMLMLFVNYIEVTLDMTLLYWISYRDKIGLADALLFGVLGEKQIKEFVSVLDHIWPYMNTGIRFFFMSLVFGYLANHLKQRKFRS